MITRLLNSPFPIGVVLLILGAMAMWHSLRTYRLHDTAIRTFAPYTEEPSTAVSAHLMIQFARGERDTAQWMIVGSGALVVFGMILLIAGFISALPA